MPSNRSIPVEELKQLKMMLDENIITQEEFDEKKKQLLGLEGHIDKENDKSEDMINESEGLNQLKDLADSYNDVKDKATKEAFFNKLSEAIEGTFNNPYDDSIFINDEDYGITPEKPVRVAGVVQEESYLKFVNNQLGKPFSWERLSSMTIENVNGVVDVYEGSYKGDTITLYINPYGVVTTDTIPKGLRKYENSSSNTKKEYDGRFVLDKIRASINSSPYSNMNEVNWVSDFDLTYRSVDIDGISPPFDVVWTSLENYHSQKMGMNMRGLIVTFNDGVRTQSLYRIASAFAIMLAVFLESIKKPQEFRPIANITMGFVFYVANAYEELNATIYSKFKSAVISEVNSFLNLDQKLIDYEEWIKDCIDDDVLQEIKSIDSGKYLIAVGERLLNLCEEKKKVKEGILGLGSKTVNVPDVQLRNDIAVFLTRAIPNVLDEIAPFTKPSKEGEK